MSSIFDFLAADGPSHRLHHPVADFLLDLFQDQVRHLPRCLAASQSGREIVGLPQLNHSPLPSRPQHTAAAAPAEGRMKTVLVSRVVEIPEGGECCFLLRQLRR